MELADQPDRLQGVPGIGRGCTWCSNVRKSPPTPGRYSPRSWTPPGCRPACLQHGLGDGPGVGVGAVQSSRYRHGVVHRVHQGRHRSSPQRRPTVKRVTQELGGRAPTSCSTTSRSVRERRRRCRGDDDQLRAELQCTVACWCPATRMDEAAAVATADCRTGRRPVRPTRRSDRWHQGAVRQGAGPDQQRPASTRARRGRRRPGPPRRHRTPATRPAHGVRQRRQRRPSLARRSSARCCASSATTTSIEPVEIGNGTDTWPVRLRVRSRPRRARALAKRIRASAADYQPRLRHQARRSAATRPVATAASGARTASPTGWRPRRSWAAPGRFGGLGARAGIGAHAGAGAAGQLGNQCRWGRAVVGNPARHQGQRPWSASPPTPTPLPGGPPKPQQLRVLDDERSAADTSAPIWWSVSSPCTPTPPRAGGRPGTPRRPARWPEPAGDGVRRALRGVGRRGHDRRVRGGHGRRTGQRWPSLFSPVGAVSPARGRARVRPAVCLRSPAWSARSTVTPRQRSPTPSGGVVSLPVRAANSVTVRRVAAEHRHRDDCSPPDRAAVAGWRTTDWPPATPETNTASTAASGQCARMAVASDPEFSSRNAG